MEWVRSLLMGLICGMTEILPVSSRAHISIFGRILGVPLAMDLIRTGAHLAILAAVVMCCRTELTRIRRERALLKVPKRRRRRQPIRKYILLGQLLKLSGWIAAVGYVLYQKLGFLEDHLLWLAGLLLINGLILFLPTRLPSGNKDAQTFSRFDGVLMGIGGALSVLPGISRVGGITSLGTARGGDRRYVFDFSLMVSIPVLMIMFLWDAAGLVTGGLAGVSLAVIAQAAAGMLAAFLGSMAAIRGMRFLAVRAGFGGFSFYCWGAALFTFVLYLI